jgi:nucleoside-diphosphate-sugar epimerase
MKILVTGATGMVGRALTARLAREQRWSVRLALRRSPADDAPPHDVSVVGEISADTLWDDALLNCDAVVHLAARVHQMRDLSSDPLADFRKINLEGTLHLARRAAHHGVKRLVFVSTVKVNGERSEIGHPFTEDDLPGPTDPYAISKHEAESGLRRIARDTGMEVVVARPPLVYGPGVQANFAALARAVRRGLPLPLGGVHNLRSLVAVDNLADFIATCLHHPSAANQTFLVSDGEDLSSADLVRRLAHALDKPVRLVPVPPALLVLAGTLLGRGAAVHRLCDNLQIDGRKARTLLGWIPPIGVSEGLRRAVTGLKAKP